jgi:hypothetical protein
VADGVVPVEGDRVAVDLAASPTGLAASPTGLKPGLPSAAEPVGGKSSADANAFEMTGAPSGASGSTAASGVASTPPAGDHGPVPAPALPARVAELARRRSGTTEQIVVRLDPPELGTVRISLTVRGDQVHVTVRAETPEARAALDAQRDLVEDLLRGEGFDLNSFDVSHQRREQDHARSRRPAPQAPFGTEIPEAPAPAADGALRL